MNYFFLNYILLSGATALFAVWIGSSPKGARMHEVMLGVAVGCLVIAYKQFRNDNKRR